jgi:hypothetical protein
MGAPLESWRRRQPPPGAEGCSALLWRRYTSSRVRGGPTREKRAAHPWSVPCCTQRKRPGRPSAGARAAPPAPLTAVCFLERRRQHAVAAAHAAAAGRRLGGTDTHSRGGQPHQRGLALGHAQPHHHLAGLRHRGGVEGAVLAAAGRGAGRDRDGGFLQRQRRDGDAAQLARLLAAARVPDRHAALGRGRRQRVAAARGEGDGPHRHLRARGRRRAGRRAPSAPRRHARWAQAPRARSPDKHGTSCNPGRARSVVRPLSRGPPLLPPPRPPGPPSSRCGRQTFGSGSPPPGPTARAWNRPGATWTRPAPPPRW